MRVSNVFFYNMICVFLVRFCKFLNAFMWSHVKKKKHVKFMRFYCKAESHQAIVQPARLMATQLWHNVHKTGSILSWNIDHIRPPESQEKHKTKVFRAKKKTRFSINYIFHLHSNLSFVVSECHILWKLTKITRQQLVLLWEIPQSPIYVKPVHTFQKNRHI